MPRINSGETLDIRGTLEATNAEAVNLKNGSIARSKLQQEADTVFPILPGDLRVWNSMTTLLPQAAANDDLGVIEGTFGTDGVTVQTLDAKDSGTTITQYALFHFAIPASYDPGETITVRMRGGMITTVSSTTATVDIECHLHDGDGSVGSDLCATAATTINSLTKANQDFVITPTGIIVGDVLEVRITVAITDTGTSTAVIGELSKHAVLLDNKG